MIAMIKCSNILVMNSGKRVNSGNTPQNTRSLIPHIFRSRGPSGQGEWSRSNIKFKFSDRSRIGHSR